MDRFTALEVFVAIVDLGSFTKAAKRLRLSTAMVTTHLNRLEERLDVRLVNRTTRRLDLTEQGRVFLEDARQILDALRAAETSVRSGERRPAGRVRIDAPASLGTLYLVPALAALKAAYPDIVVELTLGDRGTIFRADGFDILVRVGEAPTADHVTHTLGQTRFVLVAAPDYIARRGTPCEPQDVLHHDCILYASADSPGGDPWRFQKSAELVRVRPPASFTFNDGRAISDAAIAGNGLAQTLDILVRAPVADGRLTRLMDDWTRAAIPVVVTCSPDRYRLPAVKAVVDFIVREIDWGLAVG